MRPNILAFVAKIKICLCNGAEWLKNAQDAIRHIFTLLNNFSASRTTQTHWWLCVINVNIMTQ